MSVETGNPFEHSIYTVQARCVQMIRGRCEVLDASGNQIFWAKLVSSLGPKIRVYAGKSGRTEVLRVDRPREFGPVSEIYDYAVFDCVSDVSIGTWRSQSDSWKLKPSEKFHALLMDSTRVTDDVWKLLGESRQEIGYFKRVRDLGSLFKPTATIQRGGAALKISGVPRDGWNGHVDEVHVCQIVKWDSITPRMTVDCSMDTRGKLDRRLVLSFALLVMAIELDHWMNRG